MKNKHPYSTLLSDRQLNVMQYVQTNLTYDELQNKL